MEERVEKKEKGRNGFHNGKGKYHFGYVLNLICRKGRNKTYFYCILNDKHSIRIINRMRRENTKKKEEINLISR